MDARPYGRRFVYSVEAMAWTKHLKRYVTLLLASLLVCSILFYRLSGLQWISYPFFAIDQSYPPQSDNVARVIVFVHVQKTGGTVLEERLTRNVSCGGSCVCESYERCLCQTRNHYIWLVSRFSTGWICGVHADFTEYTECLSSVLSRRDSGYVERRFDYITVLRNPIDRFVSEWLHVRRGATWISSTLRCRGKRPPSSDYRMCGFIKKIESLRRPKRKFVRSNLTLSDFLSCSHNLALNRQSRMIANLSSLGCYHHLVDWSVNRFPYNELSKHQFSLLKSALWNLLANFKMFGLTEFYTYTQYLMQLNLNISFNQPLDTFLAEGEQMNIRALRKMKKLSTSDLTRVENANRIDFIFYHSAVNVFFSRFFFYLLYDSRVPFRYKRPLHTLHLSNSATRRRTLLGSKASGHSCIGRLTDFLRSLLLKRC